MTEVFPHYRMRLPLAATSIDYPPHLRLPPSLYWFMRLLTPETVVRQTWPGHSILTHSDSSSSCICPLLFLFGSHGICHVQRPCRVRPFPCLSCFRGTKLIEMWHTSQDCGCWKGMLHPLSLPGVVTKCRRTCIIRFP